MKKLFILATLACASLHLSGAQPPAEQRAEPRVGIVNFSTCIIESKLGKQEQNAFETMRKQLVTVIEDIDKQMREISDKLKDKDTRDGLSPQAEEQAQAKYAQLSEQMQQEQQKYYQFMHQGQNKIMQTVIGGIHHAADQIALSKGYNVILNKEACFFYSPSLEVTNEVIKEMDKQFESEEKKQSSSLKSADTK